MKIETIKVSKEFKSITGGLWLGMEASVGEEENKLEAFKEGMDFLDKAFMANNPQINWNEQKPFDGYASGSPDWSPPLTGSQTVTQPTEPIDRIEAFIELLNSKYQTKKTLENLKIQVDEINDERLTSAYLERLKTFQ